MKHSLLAPSAAERWMVCTPSVLLEKGFIESLNTTKNVMSSSFADEGSISHSIAALKLKEKVLINPKKEEEIKPLTFDDIERHRHAENYADYVRKLLDKEADAVHHLSIEKTHTNTVFR